MHNKTDSHPKFEFPPKKQIVSELTPNDGASSPFVFQMRASASRMFQNELVSWIKTFNVSRFTIKSLIPLTKNVTEDHFICLRQCLMTPSHSEYTSEKLMTRAKQKKRRNFLFVLALIPAVSAGHHCHVNYCRYYPWDHERWAGTANVDKSHCGHMTSSMSILR